MTNLMTKKITLGMILAAASVFGAGAASAADNDGYWFDASGQVWKNGYKECWKTVRWTPAMAIEECDPVEKPAAKPAAPAPAPAAGPAPVAFEKITLRAETLFDFDKATLRETGKTTLNDVAAKMKKYPQVELLLVAGFTDRIGSDKYNLKLSEKRATAVVNYLVSQGVEARRLEMAAMGEADPVVSCSDVKGKESARNKKLVECLQPNRRVVIEIKAQREAMMK